MPARSTLWLSGRLLGPSPLGAVISDHSTPGKPSAGRSSSTWLITRVVIHTPTQTA